jgi:uncharacterized protein
MRYEFDWDPAKATGNLAKHSVSFEDAMSVFLDPLALSKLDDESAPGEERWITIGQNRDTKLLLVVHTHMEIAEDLAVVRIISARQPTKREARQYEEGSL